MEQGPAGLSVAGNLSRVLSRRVRDRSRNTWIAQSILTLPILMLSAAILWTRPLSLSTEGAFLGAIVLLGLVGWLWRDAMPTQVSMVPLAFWSLVPGLLGGMACYVYGGFDSAIFSQAVHNIETTGRAIVTIAHGSDHMGVHFQPILYLFAAIHRIIPQVPIYQLLLVCQLFSAVSVAALIGAGCQKSFLSSSQIDKDLLLRLFGLSILSFWGVNAAIRFDFHPETMGAFFSVGAVVAMVQGRRWLTWILLIVAACCGELFGVTSLILGTTFAMLQKRRDDIKWWDFLRFPIALIVGMAALHIYFSKGYVIFGKSQTFSVFSRYALGTSLSEIFWQLFSNPLMSVQIIFGQGKFLFLACLAAIFGGPLLCLVIRKDAGHPRDLDLRAKSRIVLTGGLFALAAPLGKVLLGQADTYLTRSNHYVADMMPGLSLMVLSGYMMALAPYRHWRRGFSAIAPTLVGLGLICANTLPVAPGTASGQDSLASFKARKDIYPRVLRSALREIPSDKSVYVNTLQVLNELSGREHLFTSYSPKVLYEGDKMPEYAVLGWPPTHGYDKPSEEEFEHSFRMVGDGLIESIYQGRVTRYRLESFFPAKLPGDLWVWRRG